MKLYCVKTPILYEEYSSTTYRKKIMNIVSHETSIAYLNQRLATDVAGAAMQIGMSVGKRVYPSGGLIILSIGDEGIMTREVKATYGDEPLMDTETNTHPTFAQILCFTLKRFW